MNKKFLGKKVLVSLLTGGLLYSGGALLPDYAVDKAVQLLPGMINVAMATDYEGTLSADTIISDLGGDDTIKNTIDTAGNSLTIKGNTSTTLVYSLIGGGRVTLLHKNLTINSGIYLRGATFIGDGTEDSSYLYKVTVTDAGSFCENVTLLANTEVHLKGGIVSTVFTVGSTDSVLKTYYKDLIEIEGNVKFEGNGAIVFNKSASNPANNYKNLHINGSSSLEIKADKITFDGKDSNFLKNDGTVIFTDGILDEDVFITNGTSTTTGAVRIKSAGAAGTGVTMGANQVQCGGGIIIDNGATLTLTSGTSDESKELKVDITSVTGGTGKLIVKNGSVVKTAASTSTSSGTTTNIGKSGQFVDIDNAGTMDIKGDIYGNIVNSGGSTTDENEVGFKLDGNFEGGNLINTGNFCLSNGSKKIEGNGDITNNGLMSVAGVIKRENYSITNTGKFTVSTGTDVANRKEVQVKKISNSSSFIANAKVTASDGIVNNLGAIMKIYGETSGGLIDNSGTLTINGPVGNDIHNQSTGTVTAGTGALSGAVDNDGDFTVDAGNISTVSFDNSGTLHLGGADGVSSGKLTKGIVDGQSTKTGVLEITGTDVVVDSGVSAITQKSLTIADGAKLTTDLDKLTISDKYITNKGTLVVSDDSILTIDIKDSNGTTELTSGKKLVVGEDHTIEGTLNGNGGTIDMTERGLGLLKSDTELQKLENAEIHTLTIGKLAGGLNLKIDVDMANFTADKLIVGAADYASLTLSSINVIKDYIPQKDDYGTDDFEINVPTVIDGIHGDDTKAQNAITFVDGEGANNVNCTMGGGTSATGILGEYVPTYSSETTTTEVITNNYKYTFAMGDTKGTLDYKVEQLNVMFKDFIEGTLPGYGTADGDNKEVDPSILCLTENMTINKEDPDVAIVADMNNAAQKNAELKINLNGKTLDAQTTATDGITVKVGDAKKLNINGGGETAGIITDKVNFDVAEGGALVFDGKTEIYGKINNKSIHISLDEEDNPIFDGGVINNGDVTLNGEITNDGLIANNGVMKINNNVSGGTDGAIINNVSSGTYPNMILSKGTNDPTTIANKLINYGGNVIIEEGVSVTGEIQNDVSIDGNVEGLITVKNAASLAYSEVINNYCIMDILSGELTRNIDNDGIIYYTSGTIKSSITQGTVLSAEEDEQKLVVHGAEVTFDGNGKEIKNKVDVKNINEETGGATLIIENGTISGDVYIEEGSTLTNNTNGKISGFVLNEGTMETKANGITGHTAVDYTGENKNVGVQNLNSLTLYSGELGTGIMDVDSGELKGTTYIASGGTVTNGTKNYTITQKSLIIKEDGSLTTDVDVVHIGTEDAGPIVNEGTLTFTADGDGNGQYGDDTEIVDTLQEEITDNAGTASGGTLNFGTSGGTNKFHALRDITQNVVNVHENLDMDAKLTTTNGVNVDDDRVLTISADNLKSKVTNGTVDDPANKTGIVQLEAGTLEEAKGYTITGGKIEILGDVTASVINLQSTKGIVNEKSVLTLKGADALVDNIYGVDDEGDQSLYATKYGTTVIDSTGTIETEKTINNNVVVANGKLQLNVSTGTGTVVGGVIVAKGAELDAATNGGIIKNAKPQEDEDVPTTTPQIGANKVINLGKLSAKVDNIQGFEEVINTCSTGTDGSLTNGTLILKGPTDKGLQYNITDGGVMGHGGVTIIEGGCVSNVTNTAIENYGGNKQIVQKELKIQNGGSLVTDADYLQISDLITNDVDKGLVLVDEGTLNTDVDGTGSTQIGNADKVADVTMNGKFNQNIKITEKGTLRISASNLQGDDNIDEGLLILGAGTLEKPVNGDGVGSIEYAGDVTVTQMPTSLKGMKIDDGVKVDFSRANESTMSVSDVNIGNNTTMILKSPGGASPRTVDDLSSDIAAIKGVDVSFNTGTGNVLYLTGNVQQGVTYVIVGGEAVTGNERPWDLVESDNFDVELVYISDPKAFGETKSGVVAFKALPAPSIVKSINCDAPNVFTEMKNVLPVESEERQFLREINSNYNYIHGDKQKGLDAWNSVASLDAVAGVTQNVVTSNALALATVGEHLMSVKTPVAYSYRSGKARLIDTVSDNMMGMIPEIIPGGDTQSVMPQRVTGRSSRAVSRQSRSGGSSKKYQITSENQLWASYIQSKETIDGLKAGDATNNSDIKYKGASVGVDMWSTDKSIGGVYGSYVEGKVDAYNSAAITRNEIDNYGVGIYNRLDYKFASVLIDAGYVHSKNDIKQENLGREITAKPKVEAYSAGIRIEKVCAAGSSMITPFVGVRYMNVHTKAYDNNYGVHYKIDDEDVVTIPVGLKWCADLNPDSKMRFRPSLEAGYTFNIGADNNKQKISFNGVTDTVKFDALDKGNYFVRVGMEFVGSNTLLGLFYNYTKGDHVKDKKVNVNLSFDF